MTYRPKTRAERWFRWSVFASRRGNRRRKIKKHDWANDDYWWYGEQRRRRSLDREHARDVRDALEER